MKAAQIAQRAKWNRMVASDLRAAGRKMQAEARDSQAQALESQLPSHCEKCGRQLTDGRSRALGIGPECRRNQKVLAG